MARTPDGPPPAPAVQKLRIRWAKRGRMRFTSHRDFQRAFERALRKAGVPVALSAGFNPHPRISYAGAAPTGTGSEAEYVEVSLTSCVEPMSILAALDAALPEGLDILDVVEAPAGRSGNLPERLEASVWRIELPGVLPASASLAVAAFLAAPVVEVQRLTKDGIRRFDARAAVAALTVEERNGAPEPAVAAIDGDVEQPCAILRVVVRHGSPTVRPDDVLSGLRMVADLVPPVPPRAVRLAQGPLDETAGAVTDPLLPDRDAVGAPGATSAGA